MKRLKMLILLISISLLFGCSNAKENKPSEIDSELSATEVKNTSQIIESFIEEKYGVDVFVKKLEWKEEYYQALMTKQEDQRLPFTAKYYPDLEKIVDDFPQLIYAESVTDIVQPILDDHPLIVKSKHFMIYQMYEETWRNSEQLQDFITNSETSLRVTVTYGDISKSQLADDLFSLCSELNSQGFDYLMSVITLEKVFILAPYYVDDKLSKEHIIDIVDRNVDN